MTNFKAITFEKTNNLAIIALNRPECLNALNATMKLELLEAIRHVGAKHSGIRGLLITGTGRGFCAGADLIETPENKDAGSDLIDTFHPFLQELMALDIPVVTAVNGIAAGAGMSIALSADIVFASESAEFLQAFVKIGLVPDAGSSYILPRLIGEARAKAMMMLGEQLPAQTAYDWGMVHKVVSAENLMTEALDTAQKLACGPSIALAGIRTLLKESWRNSYSEQLQLEALIQRTSSQTKDCVEGVTAFAQKRVPHFSGQ